MKDPRQKGARHTQENPHKLTSVMGGAVKQEKKQEVIQRLPFLTCWAASDK